MNENLSDRQHTVKTGDDRSLTGEAFSRLVVNVFRLDGKLTAIGDELARPSGQTTARWRVLAAVEATPMSVAQIARAWSLARQSVQRVADLLAGDGLVSYENNPSHRRAKLVRITPEGRRTLTRIQGAQRAWAEGVGRQLGTAQLEAANATLARVLEALEP